MDKSKLALTDPIALAEAGYWVFPLSDRRKFSAGAIIGHHDWGDFFTDPALGHAGLLARLASAGNATGWALVLQPSDPIPLVCVDVDVYGITADEAWALFALEDVPLPPYVRTASGGHHFWFRWDANELDDEDARADKLPSTFKLAGVEGDIRASNGQRTLIVLPGTTAINKQKQVGQYNANPGFPPLDSLPPFPRHLYRRFICAEGPGIRTGGEKLLPTEALHLISLLDSGAFEYGQMNIDVAKVGQVLGRCLGWKRPSDEILAAVWEVLKDKLDDDFDERSYRTAMAGGWKRGAANRQAHGAASDIPTVTEVVEEAMRLFGGVPWLVELLDASGKTKEFILGIGGSPEDQSGRTCTIESLDDVIVALTRLSGAEMDVVATSPLFVNGKWKRALLLQLKVSRAVDILGMSPLDTAWERMRSLARSAAQGGHFCANWSGGYPSADSFIVASPSQSGAFLALKPRAVEAMLLSSGDVAQVKKLLKQRGISRKMGGRGDAKELVGLDLATIQAEAADGGLVDYVQAELVRQAQKRAGVKVIDKE